ncbi:hypothetical protein [Polynucleobacter necessarius]|uniref:hypothetical protein n=1 Tax=Polynucleobacter necessarius TaxID=576610 RepID=UPI000E08E2AC|nr:hypothetical protein [Polynucleobacter necessarius]
MRDAIKQAQDDLYQARDKLEVSIHLLNERKPEMRVSNKAPGASYESELRRWRYGWAPLIKLFQ